MSQPSSQQSPWPRAWFNPACRLCPRLAAFLDEIRVQQPGYHAAPVGPFGARDAPLVIVGLAPGKHGANRTGRPFTGDFAGILLYRSLHELGLGSQPESSAADDDLVLSVCRISNAVKCVPPDNKPNGAEVRTCNRYLAAELAEARPRAILALGKIAHDATLRALSLRIAAYRFGHGAEHALPGGTTLVDSYHCSRYNTQTRRLTSDMYREGLARAAARAGVADDRSR